MWKELVRSLYSECSFHEPSTAACLEAAESKLDLSMPAALREVLLETNGIEGEYGLGWLWPLERIVDGNLKFRRFEEFQRLYMPFNHLLFFADAGNGDQFAFPIDADGVIRRSDVFAWQHESDSRLWIAPSLVRYFEWMAAGRIRL